MQLPLRWSPSVNCRMWWFSCSFCICCLLFHLQQNLLLLVYASVRRKVFMDSCNYPYVLRAMLVFGVLSVNWEMWCFSCNFCFCCIVSSSPFLCLSLSQFVSEAFIDSCNYPYVFLALPVIGVFSVNWRMSFLLCTFCICFLLSSFVPYFCLSILQFVSETFLDLCNYPYVLRAMPVFGGFGGCHVPSVFAVFYLHRQLTVTNWLHILFLRI